MASLPPGPTFLHGIDAPKVRPGSRRFRLIGWAGGADASTAVRSVQLVDALGQRSEPLPLVARPDLADVHPDVGHLTGFDGVVDARWAARGLLELMVTTADGEHRLTHDLPSGVDTAAKAWKLARILKVLKPGLRYEQTPYAFDFLDEATRASFNIVDTDAVSDHGYDPLARGVIDAFPDGLVLDCGAGCRREYLPNVVNFEIVPYPSTDVVGVGEDLPFADGAFDAVLTLDVLEHVKDPFRCAQEIARVLKPGGRLYAVVPFLQPYHGYPHHYYNMTHQGLANLFAGTVEIETQAVPLSGQPIHTLAWFLQRYVDGLPKATAESFKRMTVAELMAAAETQLGHPHVTTLADETRLHLASTTMLLGKKRS